MDFVIAGVAAVGAGFFSNPLEVLKTRMQLQGELRAKGQYAVHYKNIFHATYMIVKHDGILSLQKGLSPALWVQFIMNGVRLGIYQTLEDQGYVLDKNGNTVFYKSVIAGGIGGVAGQLACSPVFLVKTHLQTQSSETIAVGYQHQHQGMWQALKIIYKDHGDKTTFLYHVIPSGTFQFGENRGYLNDENGNLVFYKSVLVGGTGGVIGQYFASPFFLVKTHLQAQAAEAIAVGHQHNHDGTWSALKKIFYKNGLKGLFRGAGASVPRAFVGSTSQLTSFKYAKEFLNRYDYFSDKPLLTSFCGSMVGGVAISVMMTPFDLVMTRLYNQPVDANGKGILYTNYADCVLKIFKTEGISAFYKGVGPMYLRLGPHTVLCLVFWDELKLLHDKYWPK